MNLDDLGQSWMNLDKFGIGKGRFDINRKVAESYNWTIEAFGSKTLG